MGLIRKIREGADPWDARFEKPRKKPEDPDAGLDPVAEEKEVLRRRKMFGKVFEPESLNRKGSH